MRKEREATCMLLDSAEDGCVSWEMVARACLAYMSEEDVKDMCEANDFPCPWLDEEDEGEFSIEELEARAAERENEPWANSLVMGYNR